MTIPFNTFVTGLPVATALTDTESVPIVQGSTSKKITPAKLAQSVDIPGTVPDLAFWWQGDLANVNVGGQLVMMANSTPWQPNHAINQAGNNVISAQKVVQLNGKNTFTWQGNSLGRYLLQVPLLLQSCTFFAVLNPARNSGLGLPGMNICGPTNSMQFTQDTGNGKMALAQTTTALIAESNTPLVNGTWYQVNASFTGTTTAWSFRTARTSDGSGTTPGSAISVATTAIGYDPVTPSQDMDGIMAELIVYSRALTLTEIQAVEAYLFAKWGV